MTSNRLSGFDRAAGSKGVYRPGSAPFCATYLSRGNLSAGLEMKAHCTFRDTSVSAI